MELYQHGVNLGGGVHSGQSPIIAAVEDDSQLLVEVALVEQTLNAHLTHESIRRFEAESDLLPAP